MQLTSFNSLILVTKVQRGKLSWLLLLASLLSLQACQQTEYDHCEAPAGHDVICDVQAPEDLEWLPDGSGLLLSEYGHMGDSEGRLSLYEPDSKRVTVLYDSQQPAANVSGQLWGEADCDEPDYFSPHGIHLAKRPSGRWQLLVVNHRGGDSAIDDTVEMFELQSVDDHWFLQWRGCVAAGPAVLLNDISHAPRGFFASKMAEDRSTVSALMNHLFKRQRAGVLRWSHDAGWQALNGAEGILRNGVQWDQSSRQLLVSDWGRNSVDIFDNQGRLQHSLPVQRPDNISHGDAAGVYYVTGQTASFATLASCVSNHQRGCDAGFAVHRIDTTVEPPALTELYTNDGAFFGAGTAALSDDNNLYVGSFSGSRLLIADLADVQDKR